MRIGGESWWTSKPIATDEGRICIRGRKVKRVDRGSMSESQGGAKFRVGLASHSWEACR
jgi:hypothetical protein